MAEKVEVVMHDGRKVIFGKVAKVKKEIILDSDGTPTAVRFDAVNGDSETIFLSDIPDMLLAHFTAHGVSQKHGDEYSDIESPADCMETLRQIKLRTLKGLWNAERTGFTGSGILFEACKLKYPDMEAEAIREILNDMSAKEKAAFKISDEMKPFVEQVERARNKGVDTSKLLLKFQPKAA